MLSERDKPTTPCALPGTWGIVSPQLESFVLAFWVLRPKEIPGCNSPNLHDATVDFFNGKKDEKLVTLTTFFLPDWNGDSQEFLIDFQVKRFWPVRVGHFFPVESTLTRLPSRESLRRALCGSGFRLYDNGHLGLDVICSHESQCGLLTKPGLTVGRRRVCYRSGWASTKVAERQWFLRLLNVLCLTPVRPR